jgi:hypothetical protein
MALEEVQQQKAQLLREQELDRQKLAQLETAVARKQHEVRHSQRSSASHHTTNFMPDLLHR